MSAGPDLPGVPFVVSGPSGAGKTSLLRRVLGGDSGVAFSVSHTTRTPREGERDGTDYHFVDSPTFDRMISEGRFLEWAEYQGNRYGTTLDAVEGPTREGLDLILEVEVQGARQLRQSLPGAVFVFVLPPSVKVLEARLRARGSEAEDVIQRRLERARQEIREVELYDYVIVNEDLDEAVAGLRHVIAAGRLRRERVVPALGQRFGFDSGSGGPIL